MSFDAKVYFAALPDDLATKWQTALREIGMHETVLIPPDWEKEGFWYLLEKHTDEPNDSFMIAVQPLEAELEGPEYTADEKAMLTSARYSAIVSTRLSAGTVALMAAGSLAKATGGVVVDYQVAAFEKAFDADLAAHRGPRGPEDKPTLAERGFYSTELAWEVARAAGAYEQRQKAAPEEPAPARETPAKKKISPMALIVGALFVLWALNKLHKAGYF